MTTKKPIAIPEIDPVAVRKKRGLNQTQFWQKLGVTQSGGSRYESGRNIPRPVKILMAVSYGTEKQRQRVIESLTATAA